MKISWGIFLGVAVLLLLLFIGIVTYGWVSVYGEVQEDNSVSEGYDDLVQGLKETEANLRRINLVKTSRLTGVSLIERTDVNYDVTVSEDKLNILILGVDSNQASLVGRSDTLLVISIDNKEGVVNTLSIPRDTYTQLYNSGNYDKINHAFAFGGLDNAKKTVELLLDIEFDHYVVVNFTSFVGIIDALGGIEVDVPFSFSEQNSARQLNTIHFKEGVQTLDGEQALAYVRMRKHDPRGDIGRGERQQQVVEATFNKLLSISSLLKFKDVYEVVESSIETDVGVMDLVKFMPYLRSYTFESNLLSGRGIMLNGVYYYRVDEDSLNSVREKLK